MSSIPSGDIEVPATSNTSNTKFLISSERFFDIAVLTRVFFWKLNPLSVLFCNKTFVISATALSSMEQLQRYKPSSDLLSASKVHSNEMQSWVS